MDTKLIRNKIITSSEFVVKELENFLVYYNLKHTLRWGVNNNKKDSSESVAEHIYGMHVVTDYFLPFYPELNANTVRQLITWHDMAEALVDDMITNVKTDNHKQAEQKAEQLITNNAGLQIRSQIRSCFLEYESQRTMETKFVKAIDKIEPMFHMYFLAKTTTIGKEIFGTKESTWETEEYREHRRTYIGDFDILWKFDEVMTPVIKEAGYFKDC